MLAVAGTKHWADGAWLATGMCRRRGPRAGFITYLYVPIKGPLARCKQVNLCK